MNKDVLSMLDWWRPVEIQEKGLQQANKELDVWMLIQPNSDNYNKSIWENCAKVLAQKNDDLLMPYVIPLIEWIQDLTWPGAEVIFERLADFSATDLRGPISYSVMRASERDDITWLNNIADLVQRCELWPMLDFQITQLLTRTADGT